VRVTSDAEGSRYEVLAAARGRPERGTGRVALARRSHIGGVRGDDVIGRVAGADLSLTLEISSASRAFRDGAPPSTERRSRPGLDRPYRPRRSDLPLRFE